MLCICFSGNLNTSEVGDTNALQKLLKHFNLLDDTKDKDHKRETPVPLSTNTAESGTNYCDMPQPVRSGLHPFTPSFYH